MTTTLIQASASVSVCSFRLIGAMIRFLHRQQRQSTCAVACLRTVLHRQFGLRVSEDALVALGTTPEEPLIKTGSYTSHMRRIVRHASAAYNAGEPWKLVVRSKGTFTDLRRVLSKGRWPVCQVFQHGQGEYHAVVVLAVNAERVLVFDPDPSVVPNPTWYARDAFEAWWLDPEYGDTWFAIVDGGTLKEW